MPQRIDYYFTPTSPWSYLGHDRLVVLARRHRAEIAVKPIDLGRVFPVSGGLPLKQRAPQRQAYRLVELARWSKHLGVALNAQPAHFPVSGDLAAKWILAA
ncbi:MAG: DsbA family protein, partial [Casimicrobiaceae bacterium]